MSTMSGPTLTAEQREVLGLALHDALDGDFLVAAGMGVTNAGEDVGISDVRPKEVVWWAVNHLAPVVASMLADAAYRAWGEGATAATLYGSAALCGYDMPTPAEVVAWATRGVDVDPSATDVITGPQIDGEGWL